MSASNTYPDGSGYLFLILLSMFGYQYLWQKWKTKTFFSKPWIAENDYYSYEVLRDKTKELTNSTNFGFGIIRCTTVLVDGNYIPVIFGDVNYPSAKPMGPGRGYSKAFYTFAETDIVNNIIVKYPKIFKYACKNEDTTVLWIRSIRLLEKLLVKV